MNEQQNTQKVAEGYALFNSGDVPNLLKLYSEDIEFIIPGPTNVIPFAGVYRGQDQVATFFTKLHEAMNFERFEPLDYIAQGDKVVVVGYNKGHVRATGQPTEEEWAHVFQLHDGKVTRFQVFSDTAVTVSAFQARKTMAA